MDSVIDEGYDPNNDYYGYFDDTSQYQYINDRFEADAGGDWNGNFLNWLTTRRVEVAKKVLAGGNYDSCGADQCLKGEATGSMYCTDFRKKYDNPQDTTLSPACGTTTCYYGTKAGKLYFDDDSSPFSSPTATYNIHILQDSEPTGLIQDIADSTRLGAAYYYPGWAQNKSAKIEVPIKETESNKTEMIDSVRNYKPEGYTPLCRSLYTAIGYYMQADPKQAPFKDYIQNDAYVIGVQEEDPFYYADLGRYVRCGENFVVMITDGQPEGDDGVPDVSDDNGNGSELDELALWAHQENRDFRTDNGLDGKQNLEIHMIYAFGQGGDLMKETAKNGGFVDKDDDGQPDGDMIAGNGDAGNEFDADDDGIPDNYLEAQEGYELERRLFETMTKILKRASSSTAVSVLSTSSEGGGSLFQAFFKPVVYEDLRAISWVGYLNALWVDSQGNLREDSNSDNALVYDDDDIIRFAIDEETGDTEVERYADADADGKADTVTPYETVPLDELKPIWEAGEELALRDASERTIKTWVDIDGNGEVDNGEFIDFDTVNASTLRPFLNAATDAEAEDIIRFIRGEQVAGYRDRTITVNGSPKEWKLGDIVYSTPTVVGKPLENYNQYYSDYNYGEFFLKWKERGISVYVGANDGMLHAFKVGTFNEGDNPATVGKEEHGWYSATEDPATSEDLGDERWAYIPYHLLPHLKWLTDPDYAHVYYTDLKPKVSDVRIFKEPNGQPSDANHPQGWGTILIGGMRLGGGALTLTDDFGNGPGETRTFRSAYFALDITVPDSPVLLGEFTDPNLAFATSYPAIARVEATQGFEAMVKNEDDKWYFIVGSGPSNYDGSSNQQGYTFVVDLNNGSNQLELVQTFTTAENQAFMASPITLDLNLNYNVDTIYIGETYDDTGTWKGKMYRISTRSNNDPAPEPAVWPYKTDPTTNPWLMTTLFSADIPITASATASIDDDENIWIYFGTGRYYSYVDLTDTNDQYFYGIKDACAYGVCGAADEVLAADLHDSSNVMVLINKEVVNAVANNWDDFLNDVQAKDGWYLDLESTGERVTNRPSVLGGVVIFTTFIPDANICSYGGSGKLYALYYETGTAYYKDILGTETYGSTEKSLKSIDLGQGATSSVGIHVGGKSTGTGFIQQSTGVVKQVEIAPMFSLKGGIIGWKQK